MADYRGKENRTNEGNKQMTMKKIVVPFEVKEFKEDDDGFITFEGYASTYGNVDRGGDVVMSGAFDDTVKEYQGTEKLPILWQHNHDMPLGVFTDISSDSKGLFVRGKMPRDDSFVSGRVLPQMRVGSIRKMSIGYSTEDFAWDGNIRQLKRVKLWEVSLVTIPMNNSADVTGFKSVGVTDLPIADRDTAWTRLGMQTPLLSASKLGPTPRMSRTRNLPARSLVLMQTTRTSSAHTRCRMPMLSTVS